MAAVVLCTGCAEAIRFTRSDPTFIPAARSSLPPVFIDKAPSDIYRAVGTISIVAPEDTSATELASRAAAKGQTIGCDLVIAQALHHTLREADRPSLRLVHEGDEGRSASASGAQLERTQEKPSRTFEFICGVLSAKPEAPRTGA